MLKGIDPLLRGELLHLLDDMGHGDRLLLVDRNYPAASSGRPVVHLGEVTVLRAASAILSVMPLDSFIERPLARMEVDDDPGKTTPVQDAMLALASEGEGRALEFDVIPRLSFYEQARDCFAVVHTLDSVPYGCFVLTKGVVFDD
jgi:L-fucose mutarotase